MTTQALVLYNDASPELVPDAIKLINQWTQFCRSKAHEGPLPVSAIGQEIADDIAQAAGQAKAFLSEYERAAEAARKPYYERFKLMKGASDKAIMEFAEALGQLNSIITDFAREKRIVEERINRQRQEEAQRKLREEQEKARQAELERQRQEQAERDRLAAIERAKLEEKNAARRAELEKQEAEERKRQAEADALREQQRQTELVRMEQVAAVSVFEAPKTEGVSARVAFEFDITDLNAFTRYCIEQRPHWINPGKLAEAFWKREITAYLNSDAAGDRAIPGLRVFQTMVASVKRAKTPRAITVASTRVEM